MKRTWFGARTGTVTCLVGMTLLTSGCLSRDVREQEPTTSNVFVEQVREGSISEIDLLFVIDNSSSMGDKQEILRRAVPQMVSRLVNPLCENDAGDKLVNTGQCPDGYKREFSPVDDIHIGVISSSLGGHGSSRCERGEADRDNDDQGHLIPTKRPGTPDPTGLGFLAWGGGDAATRLALEADFESQVIAVGESGCGYEAPLEAWYRFLVDPSPPSEIVVGESGQSTMATDAQGVPLVDHTLLEQRAAFLRPEGLVAIVVLTDENDCSAMDGGSYYSNAGYGYLMVDRPSVQQGSSVRAMPVASPVCETNPNDRCCFSCLQTTPEGCDASFCSPPTPVAHEDDHQNTRCFENKRRFGVDLLYPTSRYVEALRDSMIIDARSGELVPNPLLLGATDEGIRRPPDQVFFAGIVGVPWQDVATQESLAEPGTMQYLTAVELAQANVDRGDGTLVDRWEVILGEPGLPTSSPDCRDGNRSGCGSQPVPPLDPFMIESIAPRTAGAQNPISGDAIVDFSSTDPLANSINGHEVNHQALHPTDGLPLNDDLQYACIFPLENPKVSCDPKDLSCDCGSEPDKNRPLCQDPAGGDAGTNQYFGKAYPGTRILQVLREFGNNSIVGSICPKIATGTDTKDANYGYNPAVQAIVDRLGVVLKGQCLPRELTLNEDGTVPCSVVETRLASDGVLDCDAPGRSMVGTEMKQAVLAQLEESDFCGENSGIPCDSYSMCAIDELRGDERQECYFNEGDPATFDETGFCYIDPAKKDEEGNFVAGGDENGNNPIVADCRATERRLLRFVGAETPAKDTTTFVACTAATASGADVIPTPAEPSAGEASL